MLLIDCLLWLLFFYSSCCFFLSFSMSSFLYRLNAHPLHLFLCCNLCRSLALLLLYLVRLLYDLFWHDLLQLVRIQVVLRFPWVAILVRGLVLVVVVWGWISYSRGQGFFTFLLLLLNLLFELWNDVFEVEKTLDWLCLGLIFRLSLLLLLFRLNPTIRLNSFRIILLSRVAVLSFRARQKLRSIILHLLCVVRLYFLDLFSDINIAVVV